MSETLAEEQAAVADDTPAPAPAAPRGPVLTLEAFARLLRPRWVAIAGSTKKKHIPGHPDEVWLKFLKIRHGREKHTEAGWRAVIDKHRNEPAHPSVLGG